MSISAQSGFVVIDVCRCSSHELSASYQEFGLLCAQRKVRGALLRIGGEDADMHYALRDVLRTVVLVAGIPLHFRLAVVAATDPMARVYGNMRQELRALGCDARIFRTERQAEHWLRAEKRPARQAAFEVAVA